MLVPHHLGSSSSRHKIVLPTSNDNISIGRSRRESDVSIPIPELSRRHAVLTRPRSGGDWFIQDLGSTNGTIVNGRRVHGPCRLCQGDVIAFGGSPNKAAFTFICQLSDAQEEEPESLCFPFETEAHSSGDGGGKRRRHSLGYTDASHEEKKLKEAEPEKVESGTQTEPVTILGKDACSSSVPQANNNELPQEQDVPDAAPMKLVLDETHHVRDHLRCAICCDWLCQPVLLSCSHSFCSQCVHDWLAGVSGNGFPPTSITCPECRTVDYFPFNIVRYRNIDAVLCWIISEHCDEDEKSEYFDRERAVMEAKLRDVESLKSKIEVATGSQRRFLLIDRVWSKNEQERFLNGIKSIAHGDCRRLYCELTSLTPQWISSASATQLSTALSNLKLKNMLHLRYGDRASNVDLCRKALNSYIDGFYFS